MNIPYFKQCGTLGVLLAFGMSSFLVGQALPKAARAEEISTSTPPTESSSAPPTISDDAIEQFLFRIPKNLQEKVKTLGSNPAQDLYIPILFGVTLDQIENSWNYKRSDGRVHKGIDIVAPRGAFVVSPTNAVVTNIGYDYSGGNYVLTANPGGEQFYYAHLEKIAVGITPGKILTRGDLVGYVGNTGNARRTKPHLHLGIYYKGVATSFYLRLTQEFSLEERVAALETIVSESGTAFAVSLHVINEHRDFLQEAQAAELALPKIITWVLENDDILAKARMLDNNMTSEARGNGVRLLQELLIGENTGPATRALANVGVTGYFGTLTQNALAEYQRAVSIIPAQGYFGPITRAHMLNLLSRDAISFETVVQKLQKTTVAPQITSIDLDLTVGSEGTAVQWLQQYLIETNSGLAALTLARVGATRYFGTLTRNALAEYQVSLGITPARGYFGPITRAHLR